MSGMSRRDFLKRSGLVAAAVSLSPYTLNTVLTTKGSENSEERDRIIGETISRVINRKAYQRQIDYLTLSRGVTNSGAQLWDKAKPGQDYVIVVAEGREKGILRASRHYFSDNERRTTFMNQCEREGQVFITGNRKRDLVM